MTTTEELKSKMEDAIAAWAIATSAEDNNDDTSTVVIAWVVVVEISSEEMEARDEWSLLKGRPKHQGVPHTVGLLQTAIDDLRP